MRPLAPTACDRPAAPRRRMPAGLVGLAGLAAAVPLLLAAAPPAARPSTPPGYVSVLFARVQDGQIGTGCQPAAGSVDIPTVLRAFAARGWIGTGIVIVNRTDPTRDQCGQGTITPSWATMSAWRQAYGFQVVSQGDYVNVKTQTPRQVYAQSCGLLPTFSHYGFTRAWGMWAYPGNVSTPQIQSQIIDRCFAYGRKYVARVNRMPIPAPYFQNTDQITGGNCNLPQLPCSHIYNWGKPYESPLKIAGEVRVSAGQWMSVQVYRLVSGSGPDWNCAASDWRAHWTRLHEDYCWNDLWSALQSVPAGARVTDPATVAAAYGRVPSGAGGRA